MVANDTPPPILTSTAAQILRVSESTVRLWERQGRLRARRTPTGVRVFDRNEVVRLAEQIAHQHSDARREP